MTSPTSTRASTSTDVESTQDPAAVLDAAGSFLAARPVEHNLMLTLLHDRARTGQPGRYWIARRGRRVVAVALQSPLDWVATVTECPKPVAVALASALALATTDGGTPLVLPGIGAEAATAAAFAGAWGECRSTAALPHEGQRLYRLDTVDPPTDVAGALRRAAADDRSALLPWMLGFLTDTRQDISDLDGILDHLLDAERLWVWDVGGEPVSMCSATLPVAGVIRVAAVYTPPSRRGHGYASGAVAALSAKILGLGCTPVLYTDLGNPTSNGIYRRIGYYAVQELVRYRFGDDASAW